MKRHASAFLTALALSALVLFAHPAHAQTVTGITVYEFGTYRGERGPKLEPAPGGMGREVGRNFELLQKTRTVVAGVGVAFGFRFLAAGGIGIDAPIHYIVHIPPPGIIGEAGQRGITLDGYDDTTRLGDPDYFGWLFDDPTDLVPGTWTFQIWSGNRKLTEQSFEVVLPGTS